MPKAEVLVLDGDGDSLSGMVFQVERGNLKQLREFGVEQSLGHLYQRMINYVGYDRFDEYKVMGLAPYGDPSVYEKVFERCYRLLPNGDYSLGGRLTWMTHLDSAGLLKAARRRGDPFTQTHKDFAAALQAMLEKIVLHILTHYQNITKQTNLCLAGGVAHNCSMNGRVLYSGLFKEVFVQPAAHDAGGALGATYGVLNNERLPVRVMKMDHLYFGTDVGEDVSIEATLESWGDFISYEKVERIAPKAAELIAGGQVVGWVQGRSEFGPRALGNRSILADPRPAENKLLINEEEAIVCYLTTGLHSLVIGSYLVRRKEVDILPLVYEQLAIRLPLSRRLVQRQSEIEPGRVEVVFELESSAC